MAVYFIRAGESGPVKIGKADSVADRLKALAETLKAGA